MRLYIPIMDMNIILGLGYADDTTGLKGDTDIDIMHHKMQKRLGLLVGWGRTKGLKFNPSNTVVVLFTRNSKLEHQPCRQLRMDGTLLTRSDTAIYLGVMLDKNYSGGIILTIEL